MTFRRTALRQFSLANSAYAGALVYAYAIDPDTNESTGELAALYTGTTGTARAANPYRLSGTGQFTTAIYFEEPLIIQIGQADVPDHETGVIYPQTGNYRGEWAPDTAYLSGETVTDGAASNDTGNFYVVAEDHTSSLDIDDDIAATLLEVVVDVEAATAAAEADLVQTEADAAATASDLLNTEADAVSTGGDKTSAEADAAATASDKTNTEADLVNTEADAVSTALDKTSAEADASATASDKTNTEADLVNTESDLVNTEADSTSSAGDKISAEADAAATASDKTNTEADLVQTEADLVNTEADVVAAAASAASLADFRQFTTTGSTNAYVGDLTPDAVLTDGAVYRFKANFTNSGAATLNLDGTGAKTIKKFFNQDLASGDIASGGFYWVQYDLSNTTFQLLTSLGQNTAAANAALSNLAAVAINTTLLPGSNDGAGLGSGTLAFSDLFLASGGVLDFNNGDATLTHASNKLSFAGATSGYTFDSSVVVGASGQTATAGVNALVEIFGTANTTALAIGGYSSTAGTAGRMIFYRSKSNAVGSATVVASGDNLGEIVAYGAQQTGTPATQNPATQIRFEVDGTVTSGAGADMPGRIIFATTPDASGTLTDRLILDAAGILKPNSNDGVALGTGALSFSDIFLASGAVVNFNNGDVTLTHSTDTLTLGGGNLALGTNSLTMTGSIAATGARVTKGWYTDLEITNTPTVGGVALASGMSVNFQYFSASGTWTKPANAKLVKVICVGAGGGGGSGKRDAAGTSRVAGGGGAGGAVAIFDFPAATLSATETVTIGAAGTGGIAATVNGTGGSDGVAGGDTYFGGSTLASSRVIARGGNNGSSGGAGGGGGGGLSNSTATYAVTAGGTGVGSGTGNEPLAQGPNPGAGGGAGGVDNTDVVGNGGRGSGSSSVFPLYRPQAAGGGTGGGTAGTSGGGGGNGGAGTVDGTSFGTLGGGGGGGGGSKTAAAGAGGAGGAPGGGGGGGGGSLNGNNSGAGGAGGAGGCFVWTFS